MNGETKSKSGRILTVAMVLAVAGALGGGYVVFQKVLADRQAAMNYNAPRARPPEQPGEGREVKTYTAEELEKLRKEGKMPRELQGHTPPANPTAQSDAAVQRTLRTLDEINRINEMNRRLMEQQQRNQR